MSEMSLVDWAKKNKIPYRTAAGWVQRGKLKARKAKYQRTLVTKTTVHGYLVKANATKPQISK